jgi:hypothetical protein
MDGLVKVAPVSGDLLVKLGLGVALGVGVWYAFHRIRGSLPDVPNAINPASPDNIINRGVSAVGGAIVTSPDGPGKNADGSWSLGAWLYDVTH